MNTLVELGEKESVGILNTILCSEAQILQSAFTGERFKSQAIMTKNYPKVDSFIQMFFARIPPQTAATFTNAQLAELKRVFGHRVTPHAIDIRLSIPFFKRGFYIVFLLGKEKR